MEDVKTGSGLKTGPQECLKSHRLLLVITRVKMTSEMYKLTVSGREEEGLYFNTQAPLSLLKRQAFPV